MTLKDIMPDELTVMLLKENSRLDAMAHRKDPSHKNDLHASWKALATEAGYSLGRTPVREAYEDGWYTPV